MSPETVRLIGLAAFLLWLQVACKYVMSSPYFPVRRSFVYATCVGAVLQVMVCVAFIVVFPSTFCYVSAITELCAFGAVFVLLRYRNTTIKPASSKLLSADVARFFKKHGLVISACIGSGAGFLVYMAPIV
jgi:hypothetical protein